VRKPALGILKLCSIISHICFQGNWHLLFQGGYGERCSESCIVTRRYWYAWCQCQFRILQFRFSIIVFRKRFQFVNNGCENRSMVVNLAFCVVFQLWKFQNWANFKGCDSYGRSFVIIHSNWSHCSCESPWTSFTLQRINWTGNWSVQLLSRYFTDKVQAVKFLIFWLLRIVK